MAIPLTQWMNADDMTLSYKGLSKEQANALIAEKLVEVSVAITECQKIADQFALTFYSPIGAYGMGGQYCGTGCYDQDGEAGRWISSSEGC